MRQFAFLVFLLAVFAPARPVFAQVYSYVDESGVRVFTSTPPTGPVRELKVTGSPAMPATASAQPDGMNGGISMPTSKTTPKSRSLSKASPAPSSKQEAIARAEYDAIIEKYAREYRMDPALIRSMIATESGFNERAVSPKGAQGLMQLMPETARRLGVRNAMDPEQNIWGGTRYMRYLLDTFSYSPDSLILSLAAYNAGENLVQRLGRMPAIRETNEYVSSIIQRYRKRQMVTPESSPPKPSLYYYFDENGVLHLTNFPPVVRPGNNNPTGGANSDFR